MAAHTLPMEGILKTDRMASPVATRTQKVWVVLFEFILVQNIDAIFELVVTFQTLKNL